MTVADKCMKISYASKADAKAQIKLIKMGKSGGKVMATRLYECERCGFWHTTSQSLKKTKSNKRKRLRSEAVFGKAKNKV